MPSINLSVVATINNTTDNLFVDDISLPEAIELEVSLATKFFGSPDASLNVDLATSTVSGDVKFGALSIPVSLPLVLPEFVKSFLSKLTTLGIPADIVADAKLAA